MEGVTGIADPDLFDGSSPAWRAYGRRLLTSDINAAAEGARQGGAQRVFVCDAHNLGNNIHTATLAAGITGLPPYSAATNLRGLPLVHRIYERSGIEAVILVGYHAMAGGGGYEPHTCMPDVVEDVRINGRSVGEIGLLAGIAGHFGVPFVAVSGDRHGVEEARKLSPRIRCAVTKERVSSNSVELKDRAANTREISSAARDGFRKRATIPAVRFASPVRFEYELSSDRHLSGIKLLPGIARRGATLSWRGDDFLHAWDSFWNIHVMVATKILREAGQAVPILGS